MTADTGARELQNHLTGFVDDAQVSDDPQVVAAYLLALRDLRSDVATAFDDVERHLMACMDDRRLETTHGVFEVHRKTKRTKWQHDELMRDLVIRLEAEAGEDLSPMDVAKELRECIGFGAGKVKALRARGFQPDEYADETPDGYSVQLPPREAPDLAEAS